MVNYQVCQLTQDLKDGKYDKPIVKQKEKSKIVRDSVFRRRAISWIKYWSGFDWWLDDTRPFWENPVLSLFNDWMDTREDQWIVSHNALENDLFFIPWSCRRSKYYRKLLHAQLRPLFGRSEKLCIHLTLTTDPNRFVNIADALCSLKKSWRKLHDYLVKKKKGNFEYLATVEIAPDHHLPHLHILIFGIPWLEDVRKISKQWEKYGQGKLVYIQKMDYKRGLKEVLKYIYKQQKDDLLGAILWATRTRSFMCNRGLLHPLCMHDPKTWVPSGYKYLGLVHQYYVGLLLKEFDVEKEFLSEKDSFTVKDPPKDWRILLDLHN